MKKVTAYKILTAVMFLISLLCAAFFWDSLICSMNSNSEELVSLNDGWYYFDDTGEKVFVELPCKLQGGEMLELFHDSIPSICLDKVIATYAAVYDVEIYAGDTLVYQFEDGGREINNAVRGNIVCSGAIPERESDQELRVVYHSRNENYRIPEITVSTAKALLKNVFLKSLFCLLVAIAMVVTGLLALILGFAIERQQGTDHRIFWIGVFLIYCGLWCVSDSAFVHLLAEYSTLIFSFDFYLFMLMPIPLSYFVLDTGDMRKYKTLKVVPILYYINISVQSLLAAFGVFTFFRMLYVTHALMMAAGVLSSLHILAREYRSNKNRETLLCIRVLASVGILGIQAIFLYEFFDYSTYQLVYQTGLLLLMTVLLNALLREFMQSVRNRTEAVVYKKLSEQDKLTKLDNRRAFDALLEKMEHGSLKYTNAAMLFLDVNYLKKANDSYGHEFGDQLIISTAQCIRNTFESFGYCYRIGGDEFCVVLLDPSYSQEELLERIHEEIEAFNRNQSLQIPLSVAIGCSFMLENGRKKTFGEWKEEADQRMYKEKKHMKAQGNL